MDEGENGFNGLTGLNRLGGLGGKKGRPREQSNKMGGVKVNYYASAS